MSAFFGGNGYRVMDQSSVKEADIRFKNAWGMADEDLYTLALREADADHAAGTPFLLQLMTTSNHRPYTYPDGRIDILSGEGRERRSEVHRLRHRPVSRTGSAQALVRQHPVRLCRRPHGRQRRLADLPVANYHIRCSSTPRT